MTITASLHLTKKEIKQGVEREIIKAWASQEDFKKATLIGALAGKPNVDRKAAFIGLNIIDPELEPLNPARYSGWENVKRLFWLQRLGIDILELPEAELKQLLTKREEYERIIVNGKPSDIKKESADRLRQQFNISPDSKISIRTNIDINSI